MVYRNQIILQNAAGILQIHTIRLLKAHLSLGLLIVNDQ